MTGPNVFEVMSMRRITLTEEDADHIKDWQKLPSESKEALNKMAKILGDENKRRSFYTILESQAEISALLATAAHLGWFGKMFLRAGLIAGVFISLSTFLKLYLMGGK